DSGGGTIFRPRDFSLFTRDSGTAERAQRLRSGKPLRLSRRSSLCPETEPDPPFRGDQLGISRQNHVVGDTLGNFLAADASNGRVGSDRRAVARRAAGA